MISRTFIFAALRQDDGNIPPRLIKPCERCEKWITACGASWVTAVNKDIMKISCPSDDTVKIMQSLNIFRRYGT